MTFPNATHYTAHFSRRELACKCGCKTPPAVEANLVIFTALVAFVFTAWGQALGITPGKRQAMQLLAPLARVLVPDASAATAPPNPTPTR